MPQTLSLCELALGSSSKILKSSTETGRKVGLGSGLDGRGQRDPGLGVCTPEKSRVKGTEREDPRATF